MFDGFTDESLVLDDVTIRVRYGGAGPAVLLIHGHPRTGATWHRVAPRLVDAGFTVVCPDMRGYGGSSAPTPLPDHSQQSKRAVAGDLVEVMGRLGHDRFSVVGHDRGSYVALRLALDRPDRVKHLVVIDGVPICEALDRCDARFAERWYHWFFYAQPDRPERAINIDPLSWYGGDPEAMGEENFAEYLEAINRPETVLAMLEDYRAGLSVDQHHERVDRDAGHHIGSPDPGRCGRSQDDMERLYGDPLTVWRRWAPDLRGHSIESGHHVAEENPEALAKSLTDFLHRRALTRRTAVDRPAGRYGSSDSCSRRFSDR